MNERPEQGEMLHAQPYRSAAHNVGEASEDSQPFHNEPTPKVREFFMVIAIVSAQVMVQACLAQGILPGELIAQSFGESRIDSSWGPAGYALTSGAFMVVAGRIGDICGHKNCFIYAWLWLAISSLLTGISKYSEKFVFYCFCRGLQGLAAAMLVPCALALLGSIYRDGTRKNLIFSLYAAGSPIGFTIGAVFASLFSQLTSWPWTFYTTAITACGAALLSYVTIPQVSQSSSSRDREDQATWDRWQKDFDWLGAFTGVGGLLLFNVAWNRAPAVGWQATEVIVTLVIGSILLITFVVVEHFVKLPLIPVDKLSVDAALVLVIMALAWSSFGVLVYYLINFTIQLRGDSMLSTAAQITPIVVTGVLASLLNTALLRRGVPSSSILALSLVWFLVGGILLASMPVHQLYWKNTFWIYVLAPFGMDLSFPSATLIMSNLVPAERQGVAASLIATVVYYSQSLGLGIAGTVQSHVSGGSILQGYRRAFYTCVGLSGFGFIVSLLPAIRTSWKGKV